MASKEARTRVRGSTLVDQVRESPVDRSSLATRRWILIAALVLLAVLAFARWNTARSEPIASVETAAHSSDSNWLRTVRHQSEKRS